MRPALIPPPDRHNSFDALRLVAALMVLWSHQFAVSGGNERSFLGYIPATLGVDIFFAISGYLNAISVTNGSPCWRFLVRRARRIFPALLGNAVFCVILGAMITTAAPQEFWAAAPDFIFRNTTTLFGLRFQLPGVFEGNLYPAVINGSLWTLPNEIKLYIYLAIAAFVVSCKPKHLGAVVAIAVIIFLGWEYVAGTATTRFNKLAILFLTGAVFAMLEKQLTLKTAVMILAPCALAALLAGGVAAGLPLVAMLAILTGKLPCPPWLRPPLDISYGVYLYAFPIQQLIAAQGLAFWPALAISLPLTIAAAIGSAVLIERPMSRPSRPPLRDVRTA